MGKPYFDNGVIHIPGVPGTVDKHKERIMALIGCKESDISVKDGEVLVKGDEKDFQVLNREYDFRLMEKRA